MQTNNNEACYLVHAFNDDVLSNMDATELAESIKRGEISSKEACRASLNRLQKVNPTLNAVAHECFDLALKQSEHLPKGFFSGVPFFVKDNLVLEGLPMTNGSEAISKNIRNSSDPFVKQALAMGFNVLGKSRLPEMGLSCASEYPDGSYVANPWNSQHIAGGSSGGSAALVASGVLPMAHGNDGAGSLRIPAAMCGLFSLKCTRGRHILSNLSRPLPLDIITEGVLTRSVRDCANFFIQLEKKYKPKNMPLLDNVSHASKTRLRVGVLRNSINGYPLDTETARVLDETVKQLESLGHQVVEAQPFTNSGYEDSFLLYFSFLAFAAAKWGKSLYGKQFERSKLDAYTQGLCKNFISNFYKIPQNLIQGLSARKQFHSQMNKYDVVLSPVLTEVAPKAGYLNPTIPYQTLLHRMTNLAGFNAIHNVMGTPSMSVPLGLSCADSKSLGLPIGMQFAANLGEDKKLLELAFELEQAVGFTQIYNQV